MRGFRRWPAARAPGRPGARAGGDPGQAMARGRAGATGKVGELLVFQGRRQGVMVGIGTNIGLIMNI